jgi:hypothetical protein
MIRGRNGAVSRVVDVGDFGFDGALEGRERALAVGATDLKGSAGRMTKI